MHIKVSTAEMTDFSRNLRSSSSELQNILDALRSKLDGIQWTGADKESYEEQRLQWDRAVHDLNVFLDQVGMGVGSSGNDYASVETTNRHMFRA